MPLRQWLQQWDRTRLDAMLRAIPFADQVDAKLIAFRPLGRADGNRLAEDTGRTSSNQINHNQPGVIWFIRLAPMPSRGHC